MLRSLEVEELQPAEASALRQQQCPLLNQVVLDEAQLRQHCSEVQQPRHVQTRPVARVLRVQAVGQRWVRQRRQEEWELQMARLSFLRDVQRRCLEHAAQDAADRPTWRRRLGRC